jgi:D-alanyl-lipoteichoic acid acyltransferase DltB (MBOAT superfamily)
LYFSIPQKLRWIWLLLASYFFYGFWKIEFAGLMLFTSLLDWYCARQVFASDKKSVKLTWMWSAIIIDIGLLFLFKYFDFALGYSPLAKSMYHNSATAWIIELGKYTIPAGISFYTFQSISYVVDVYRGEEIPEKNPLKFMLFVSFFPQLVAGPIERFGKLHGQLFAKYSPKLVDLRSGLQIMLYGMFLKVAVADNLAGVVDQYYSNHQNYSQWSSWIATFMFTVQVYYDFYGYSLLAQGSAKLFGIDLMDNFNKPFLAGSMPEFWHRWHISLSTWFRDYIFVPVGGNRSGKWRLAFAALLVFFTSGLWHGANSTMIYFGISHGLLYLLDRFVVGRRGSDSSFWMVFRRLKTVFFFWMTLVFFRSINIKQSGEIYKILFAGNSIDSNASGSMVPVLGSGDVGAAGSVAPALLNLYVPIHVTVFLIVALILDHFVVMVRVDSWISTKPWWTRWFFYVFFIIAVLFWGGAVNHPFVYFQF